MAILLIATAAVTTGEASGSPGSGPGLESRADDEPQIKESISKFEALSREQPQSAEIWSNLGVLRAMAGDCEEALPALQRAESLNPKLYNPWFFSAYCQFSFHETQQAGKSVHRAVQLNPRDANAWFLLAQTSYDLGQYTDSLDALVRTHTLAAEAAGTAEAKVSPQTGPRKGDDPDSFYLAGKDALELATQIYDRVMEPQPQPEFYSLLLDGERNAALAGWELALNKYQLAVGVNQNRPEAHFALGSAYLESGHLTEAEDSFQHCLKLVPDSAWARLRLALTYAEEGKKDQALTLFSNLRMRSLVLPAEYSDYAACAYLLSRDNEARSALIRGVNTFPFDSRWKDWSARLDESGVQVGHEARAYKPTGLTGVGLSLYFFLSQTGAKGNVFENLFPSPAAYETFRSDMLGRKWMRTTGRIIPYLKAREAADSPARLFAMGEILHSLSYGFHEQLGAQFPDSTPAMKLAAGNYFALGEKQKALEIYQAIEKKDGPSPEILGEIARVYWSDHHWKEALDVLEPLSQMDPRDATIFVNIARIYVYEQKPEAAASAFERAIKLAPGMSEAHLGLALVLRGKGDLERALDETQIASKLAPVNPRPHYVLSQIYNRLGKKELAAREMQDFERLGNAAKTEARERNELLVPVD